MTIPNTRRRSAAAAAAAGEGQLNILGNKYNNSSKTYTGYQDSKASNVEMVTSEPLLVGNGKHSIKNNLRIYDAVDYLGTRFRVGDHVSMYNAEGREWVCVLEYLFFDEEEQKPKFQGRWFWSIDDVEIHKDKFKQMMRPSKSIAHELIACDSRDINLVESIRRKCNILSFNNFQLIKKTITSNPSQFEKIYFCERQFYHKAYRFTELNNILFPGDPIPMDIRKAAGLPLMESNSNSSLLNNSNNYNTDNHSNSNSDSNNNSNNNNDNKIGEMNSEPLDISTAYYEPDYTGKTRKKKEKSSNVSSDPIIIW